MIRANPEILEVSLKLSATGAGTRLLCFVRSTHLAAPCENIQFVLYSASFAPSDPPLIQCNFRSIMTRKWLNKDEKTVWKTLLEGVKNTIYYCPKGVQTSNQKLVVHPFPRKILLNWRARGLRSRSFLHAQESLGAGSMIQKDFSFKCLLQRHSTHSEGDSESGSQMNLRHRTWFQIVKFLRPRPTSFFGRQTVDWATLAMLLSQCSQTIRSGST